MVFILADDLGHDLSEQNNLASQNSDKVRELSALLEKVRSAGRSRP